MVPPLTAVALQNAILFGIYGNTLKLFDAQPNGSYTPSQVAVAGSMAGLAQCFIVCPLDLVKIKLQMQTEGTITLLLLTFNVEYIAIVSEEL